MFHTKVVDKIKTHILCSVTFFLKSCRLRDNVGKYCGAWGATNDVTIWRIGAACCISKATWTHAHAHAHTPEHLHVRTYTSARTHRQIYNTYCFYTANMISESASMLRCTYISCLVRRSLGHLKEHCAYLKTSNFFFCGFTIQEMSFSIVALLHHFYPVLLVSC